MKMNKKSVDIIVFLCIIGFTSLLSAYSEKGLWSNTEVARETCSTEIYTYMNGVAYILERRRLEFNGSYASFTVPSSYIPGSLRITGVTYNEVRIRSKEVEPKALVKGDEIVVETHEASYVGVYGGTLGEYLLLQVNNTTQMIRLTEIVAIRLKKLVRMEEEEGYTVYAASPIVGEKEATISYLARTVSWDAYLKLDLETSMLEVWAHVKSTINYDEASLILVLGEPNLVLQPVVQYERTGYKLAAPPTPYEAGWTPQESYEYHFYRLEEKISITPNEEVSLKLMEGIVGISEFYRWSFSGRLPCNWYLNLTNPFGEPIPNGVLTVYGGELWLGTTITNYIPAGGNGEVLVGKAVDTIGEKTVLRREVTWNQRTITERIRIWNYKDEAIRVEVSTYLPYNAELVETSIEPYESNERVVWWITVDAGSCFDITYTYKVYERG